MKRLSLIMWLLLILQIAVYGLFTDVTDDVWCQVFVGGSLLVFLLVCIAATVAAFGSEGKMQKTVFSVPDIKKEDVIYDLQEYQDGLVSAEIRTERVRDCRLVVDRNWNRVYFLVNGLEFDMAEFDKTWCVDKKRAEELADGFPKDR